MTQRSRPGMNLEEDVMNATMQIPAPSTYTPRRTADFTLKAHCGCGYKADTVEGGLSHAEATGHTLHITGEIRTK